MEKCQECKKGFLLEKNKAGKLYCSSCEKEMPHCDQCTTEGKCDICDARIAKLDRNS